MQPPFQSNIYEFLACLSKNEVAESWTAINKKTGNKCFLKIAAADSPLGEDRVKSILIKSFESQRKLKSPAVHTAISKRVEKGYLLIEYPFINTEKWKTVTPDVLAGNLKSLLSEIFLIIDYLHFMGYVHCDLKLDNFMFSGDGGNFRVRLTDLDFLQTNYSTPQGKILGTPDHIAPEVMNNEIFTIQSDNYSIGRSLQLLLDTGNESLPDSSRSIQKLIEYMISDDQVDRPAVLIDALLKHQIIDPERHQSLNRRLFGMQILSGYLSEIRIKYPSPGQFSRFLQEKSKLFGLSFEIQNDFFEMHEHNTLSAFRTAREFIENSDISRFENFWHLSISDENLNTFLEKTDRFADLLVNFSQLKKSISRKSYLDAMTWVMTLYHDERYLRSYQMLKYLHDSIDEYPDIGLNYLLHENLARVAIALNRTDEAAGYLIEMQEIMKEDPIMSSEIMLDLAFLYIKAGKIDDAAAIVPDGIRITQETRNKNAELEFRRLHAWIMSTKGDHIEAREILENVAKKAAEIKNHELLVKTYNYMGSIERRTGKFERAREYYLKSVEEAKAADIMFAAVSSLTNLSMLAFETGDYKKTIKFAKLALRSIESPADTYVVPYNHRMLTLCFTRMGEYDKAGYWNQEYLAVGLPSYNADVFGTFYLNDGWIKLNRGRMLLSIDSISSAIHILEPSGASNNLGKSYLSLAENSFYRGEASQTVKYLKRAREIFDIIGDAAALADTELIKVLNEIYNYHENSFKDLLEVYKRLLGFNSIYFAAAALLHLLLKDQPAENALILDESPAISEHIERADAPLFRAVKAMMIFHRAASSDYIKNANQLKTIYRILHDSGRFFEAMLLCDKIAALYIENSQNKLASKFIRQALKIANTIKNKNWASQLIDRLESVPASESQKEQAVDYLHNISDIIKDLSNYEITLNKLIQFAVEETGAERGVLLLRSDPNSELKVRSYVNCDDDSLRDIRDFSRNIPFQVDRSLEPFIIENAMTDSRTRGFKSIAIHNILSVICMPIFKDKYAVGVIYLDHHTIPALFDEEDIRLINSMANLISMVLSTAMDYRKVMSSRDRMLYDLNRMGSGKSFITQNEEMLKILEKLPRVASTNTSILLIGESGTGKEILCEMIHEYSLRKDAPLVKLNCAAIPDTLIESELFGVARHAATGVDAREGKFQAADGGTLFLDEIGDMPLETQAKILRVLEYQEFEKVGSNRKISTDIRFIYATNQNLHQMVQKGSFRSDLFYRINAFSIEIPPLRDRQEDIQLLIEHFIEIFSAGSGSPPRISTPAMDRMMIYKWPGNVRELKNVIENFCILYPGKTIEPGDLPTDMHDKDMQMSNVSKSAKFKEKQNIRKLLIENNWNQSEVARILDMPLSTLRRRIKKYRIKKL